MSTQDTNKKDKVEKKIQETNVSVYAYDMALVNDLRARFRKKNGAKNELVNESVQIGSANNMFSILGSMDDDQVNMPFVSLERLGWQLTGEKQEYQSFVGSKVLKTQDKNGNMIQVRAQIIPITIDYRLSVWTKDRVTNDALMRELLFYYTLRPTLMCYIKHGLDIAHNFNIYFDNNIEDNSDIANHNTNGTYFRQDITLTAEDCYLWRANYENLVELDVNTYFYYGEDKNNTAGSYEV